MYNYSKFLESESSFIEFICSQTKLKIDKFININYWFSIIDIDERTRYAESIYIEGDSSRLTLL